MGLGTLGESKKSEEDFDAPIVAEINITPLVDIFLVLLIIFMVTSSVMNQMGVQIQLPNSNQAATASESGGVLVSVTQSGEISVNGVSVSPEQLSFALKKSLEKSTDKTVLLEGDKNAVLGKVVQIMDEAKKAGAQKFSVATSSQSN